MGVTKVDADVGGYSELAMIGEFCAPIPRGRGHSPMRQVSDLLDQGTHNAVLAVYFDQHDKTRPAFNQSGNVNRPGFAGDVQPD